MADDNEYDLNPEQSAERSLAGQPIYRHKERTKPFEPAVGDMETIGAVEAHIAAHLGEVDSVFHEIISDLVHIDVHVVKPTDDRPWYSLVTSGMSDRPMNTPEGAHDVRFAELMINLPADWPLESKDKPGQINSDPKAYWPIGWLKMIARMPHEYSTWVGFGHTIPNGDPAEPFADNTKFIGSILLPPLLTPEGFHELKLEGRTVHFYALCPLYSEEMDQKLKGGTESLFAAFEKAGVPPTEVEVVTLGRKNACKRKGWWPF